MATKSPVFPMPEPQHFSDYGFDPQIDYFQVLEEARKHSKETRSIESHHFKLQKPIPKGEQAKKSKKKRWVSTLFFWKWKKWERPAVSRGSVFESCRAVSGPVYSIDGSVTPSRGSRTSSGPLAGTATPARKGELDIPYLSLKELNLEHHRISASTPIYLVT